MSASLSAWGAGAKRLRLAPIALVLFIIAGLFAFDFALEETERTELHREADRSYAEASQLLSQGKPAEALPRFERAHTLERTNRGYVMGLVTALTATGAYGQAQTLIDDVLAKDPNNGRANLLAARLSQRSGQLQSADAYYHRAIYGAWPDDNAGPRIQARLELIRALAARGDTPDLLPELLPLESAARRQPAVLKEVAALYLQAGSPRRSAEAYRQLMLDNPQDPDLPRGLGEAELADGDFRAAQTAFLAAFRLRPNDPGIRSGMELSSSLYALDPTPRRMRSAEKYQRSSRILQLAREQAEVCASHFTADSPEAIRLREKAQAAEGPDAPQPVTNELAEQTLSGAEQLWLVQRQTCPSANSLADKELSLIMRKLAQ